MPPFSIFSWSGNGSCSSAPSVILARSVLQTRVRHPSRLALVLCKSFAHALHWCALIMLPPLRQPFPGRFASPKTRILTIKFVSARHRSVWREPNCLRYRVSCTGDHRARRTSSRHGCRTERNVRRPSSGRVSDLSAPTRGHSLHPFEYPSALAWSINTRATIS